jgi:hypothetical protein
MGNVRRKVRSLQVLKLDLERRAIVVKGSIPGKAGNILEIAPAKVRLAHSGKALLVLLGGGTRPVSMQQQQQVATGPSVM